MSRSRVINRNYSLDVLRGLAALSVVLWHWQHFFYVAGRPVNFRTENQPFFEYLSLFYLHGSLAVELFFSISGFVFFWLYAIPIQEKKEN
ncbi:acyltransferase family protein [Pantoea agglomerans]|uniref:acyltransferase family protein n=1 Tax=Enterobacter agglomerans TaxID=549 RepID=UPI0022A8B08D|nr:acyltransferase family protein [Pantoea agglomerans]UJL35757.1 acyltransferase family protein [Pantoea agglomerans]